MGNPAARPHGVISPGGVGYDINCGVRLLATARNHRLLLQRDGERWRARVVLDV